MRRLDPRPTKLTWSAWQVLVIAAAIATTGMLADGTRDARAGETYRRVQLAPRDEAMADPSFRAFRTTLDAAVAAKDARALRALLAPDVLISFGGESGPDAFFERWQPSDADSKLWELLAELLRSGSTFARDADSAAATYPYAFESFPDDFDAFTSGVIVGRNVNVRERPDAESPVVAQLSYDVVRVPDWGYDSHTGAPPAWVRVELWDGRAGFVAKTLVRSPVDYRVGFEERAGRWMLAFLVAGD